MREARTCGRCGAKNLQAYAEAWITDVRTEVRCTTCDDAKRLAEFRADGRLRTGTTTTAAVHGVRAEYGHGCDPTWLAIDAARKTVQTRIRAFDADVWLEGLGRIVDAERSRGMKSAEFPSPSGPARLMTFTSAGRVMLTIDAELASVSMLTAEGEWTPRMGMQGIDATADEAIALIDAATEAWRAGTLAMAADNAVGIG